MNGVSSSMNVKLRRARARKHRCYVRNISSGNSDFIQSVGLGSAVSAGPCSGWALTCTLVRLAR